MVGFIYINFFFLDPERQAKGSYTITFFVSCHKKFLHVTKIFRVTKNFFVSQKFFVSVTQNLFRVN